MPLLFAKSLTVNHSLTTYSRLIASPIVQAFAVVRRCFSRHETPPNAKQRPIQAFEGLFMFMIRFIYKFNHRGEKAVYFRAANLVCRRGFLKEIMKHQSIISISIQLKKVKTFLKKLKLGFFYFSLFAPENAKHKQNKKT